MTNMINTREIVLDILLEITGNGAFSHNVLKQALQKYQYMEKRDRAFITIVTEGTMENLIHIDYMIDQFSKVKTKKMKPVILNILRLSVYQIKFMDSIPNAAVCNEAVKLTTKRGFSQLKGFVNGVLRAITRNIEQISYPDASENLLKHLSVMYSMPEWIVEQWIFQYGTEEASRMIRSTLEADHRISVRCNISKCSVEECVKMLEDEGVRAEANEYLKEGLYLSGVDYLGALKTFQEGYFMVQDVSSMFVAKTADPKEGDFCIDVCAAPGGKSIHLADLLHGTGMVEARDVSEYKIGLIQSNIDRTGFQNIRTVVKDGFCEDKEMEEKADIVIADLPCSGLGVVGKKSDIKYNMTREKQKELVKVQRCILNNAVKLVKPGGTLIFSTCTTNKEENEENYQWLLENYPLEPCDISEYFSKEIAGNTAKLGYVQMLLGITKTDGFFVSKFTKHNLEK